ncbi:MAG: translation initiation factor IF-3 [Gammaproteobacteria bacterium RIFCSPHIGHO2_02_FULL_42_13]|nr:MAG: translation initiation factor IF-3 [Gammaproteobacteria bacterium RIFCSPHIGHO2_02_FULL_42_13]OGT68732.1 MAG: translation initiation factor IF-3 [Gammaproteobacteria bacterium RIFCSPLOWO2_02_FULL_42_9]
MINEKGEQLGILSRQAALAKAIAVGLDLVEISPNAEPPVCRIMDHGKYVFQLKKKQSASKKKQKQMQIKQIRIRPGIGEGDYQVKLRNLIRFLTHGDKVEVQLRFRGREAAHREIGMEVLKRMQHDVETHSDTEQAPTFEGRQMRMVLVPKKVK